MSKKYNINGLQDLNVKLISLKVDYKMQETMLKQDAQSYIKQFTPGNLIKKYVTPTSLLKADDKLNISSKVMSFVLPVLMNGTLFRGSGFITLAFSRSSPCDSLPKSRSRGLWRACSPLPCGSSRC